MRMPGRPEAGGPAELDYDLLRAGLQAAQSVTPTAQAHAVIAARAARDLDPVPPAPDYLPSGSVPGGSYLGLAKVMIDKPR